MKCYKIVIKRNGKYFSTNKHYDILFSQTYSKHEINFPKFANSEIFVFKNFHDADMFADSRFTYSEDYEIWECYCPSLSKIKPMSPGFMDKYERENFWSLVKKARSLKRSATSVNPNGAVNCHSTSYIKYIRTLKEHKVR
jgi:hypothetical protein